MRTNDNAYRVETTSRLAQWRIDNLATCIYRKSDPFKMGNWNWHLSVEKNRELYIKLFPAISNPNREQLPVVSFVARVCSCHGERWSLTHPEVKDRQLKSSDDFIWAVDAPHTGKFIIDIEFYELKIADQNGGDASSIWTGGSFEEHSKIGALTTLRQMLSEDIHTDIMIKTSDGIIGAHRSILAARSPVFQSMFSHTFREKELSTIDIPDMSITACRAFLNYTYGNLLAEEFLAHRLQLLKAADKYDIFDLKEACHESLVEDIDTNNVLERLQTAHLYQLPVLKSSCLRYLIHFGKIYEIRDDFNDFLDMADRKLISEIFQEILYAWRGF